VNRFAKMTSKEVVNHSFIQYCDNSGLPTPNQYRMAFSNLAAGYKSGGKYDKGQPVLDADAWEVAGEWTKQHFQIAMSGSEVLDRDHVLIEMDMTTSPGYPWNRSFSTKNDMRYEYQTGADGKFVIGKDGQRVILRESPCMAAIDDYWELIGLEKEPEMVPIWTCSQKIEMRSVKKLMDNNLRTFTACPFELSVATNRL